MSNSFFYRHNFWEVRYPLYTIFRYYHNMQGMLIAQVLLLSTCGAFAFGVCIYGAYRICFLHLTWVRYLLFF